MTTTKVKKNYKDVTMQWKKESTPNSHVVKDRDYFEMNNGKRYYVDGKNVVLDYSLEEKEIAIWLENTLGGEIYMLPRINKPNGIRTADYLFRGEYWDLKKIKVSGKNVIDNRINGLKKQACNFILDISNNSLKETELIKQVEQIFQSSRRDWINKIILIRDMKLIKIYERKRD